MDRLQRVLRNRTGDLAHMLESQTGIQETMAERFVQVAGDELVHSFAWQRADLGQADLSSPSTVRDLMNGVSAIRIASALGMSSTEVWTGLRAFVPRVMELVEATPPVTPRHEPWNSDPRPRWARQVLLAAAGFLHPIE